MITRRHDDLDALNSSYHKPLAVFLTTMSSSAVPNSAPKRLQGKVAVITGSLSGIGRAIALAYHREGCTVVCSDISSNNAEELQTHEIISKEGGTTTFCKTDVSQTDDMKALVQTAVDKYGRIDM